MTAARTQPDTPLDSAISTLKAAAELFLYAAASGDIARIADAAQALYLPSGRLATLARAAPSRPH